MLRCFALFAFLLPGWAEEADPVLSAKMERTEVVIHRAERPINPDIEEMRRESAVFLQRRLGVWTRQEAAALLGTPSRRRDAVGDRNQPDGDILTFSDPTGQYDRFELDFVRRTGKLRRVYVYPKEMSWTDCQELWGEAVRARQLKSGGRFVSYLNRRLDVVVDAGEHVISLGLY